MKRSVWLVLALAPVGAHAGLESILNPMALANPTANPLSMALPLGGAMLAPNLMGSPFGGGFGYGSNPLTGFGAPLSGYGSPFGGYGNPLTGYGSPLGGYGSPFGGLGSPLGGLAGASLLRPAIQVAPNLLSLQHQAPQMLTNPYMGGPFSQLPFAQQSRPSGFGANPFGNSNFGAQSYPYGYAPNGVPAQPSFGSAWQGNAKQVTAQPAPVASANPYLPPGNSTQVQSPQAQAQSTQASAVVAAQPVAVTPALSAAQAASAQALVGSVFDLLKSLATTPPASSGPVPTSVPFTSPWGADSPAGQAPGGISAMAPAAVPATANPWGGAPVPAPQGMTVQTAPSIPETPSQVQAESSDAALTPFDPAYWLLPPELPEPGK